MAVISPRTDVRPDRRISAGPQAGALLLLHVGASLVLWWLLYVAARIFVLG